jgi:pilus assembly protein CpaC
MHTEKTAMPARNMATRRKATRSMAARMAARAATVVFLLAPCIVLQRADAGEMTLDTQPTQIIHVAASDLGSRAVTLGQSKSVVIDLPHDIKDVLVADPKIANAVVRSSRRAYIIGIAVGQTNVFFFDASGKQIAGFDIAVTRDLNGIRQAIKQVIPDSDVSVEGIGEGVILAGSVANDAESQQAYDIAVRLLNDGTALTVGQGNKVVNAIVVRGRDQVMLKVTVAEVERDLIKQLGINLSGSVGYGTSVVNFNNTNPFTATGQSLSGSSIAATWRSITGTLQAMEQAGVIHTLAEPNLTAPHSSPAASFRSSMAIRAARSPPARR